MVANGDALTQPDLTEGMRADQLLESAIYAQQPQLQAQREPSAATAPAQEAPAAVASPQAPPAAAAPAQPRPFLPLMALEGPTPAASGPGFVRSTVQRWDQMSPYVNAAARTVGDVAQCLGQGAAAAADAGFSLLPQQPARYAVASPSEASWSVPLTPAGAFYEAPHIAARRQQMQSALNPFVGQGRPAGLSLARNMPRESRLPGCGGRDGQAELDMRMQLVAAQQREAESERIRLQQEAQLQQQWQLLLQQRQQLQQRPPAPLPVQGVQAPEQPQQLPEQRREPPQQQPPPPP